MTSDPGLTCQDSDYATQIQETLDELQQMQEVPRVRSSTSATKRQTRVEDQGSAAGIAGAPWCEWIMPQRQEHSRFRGWFHRRQSGYAWRAACPQGQLRWRLRCNRS